MSQGEFAACFGVNPATLRDWEQGRRQPEGPARALLNIIASQLDADELIPRNSTSHLLRAPLIVSPN